MTSLALILGVLPLLLATGAGANAHASLGLSVFSGMIASTGLAILFVPSLFVAVQRLEERVRTRSRAEAPGPAGCSGEPNSPPAWGHAGAVCSKAGPRGGQHHGEGKPWLRQDRWQDAACSSRAASLWPCHDQASGRRPAAAVPSSVAWPHTVSGRGGSATIYQPQVISWPGQTTLTARAAVAVTRQGGGAPILGTVEVTATTSTDFATRTVTLSDLTPGRLAFPLAGHRTQAAQLETRIRAALPAIAYKAVPLDTVLLSLRDSTSVPGDPAVSNEPPVIFYSARPASLVVFDGEPVLAPIAGSTLSLVVNTNWDLFFDPAGDGAWYLLNNGSWFAAARATGPWQPTEALPEALRSLPDEPNLAEARRAIPGRPVAPGAVPTIFVSTKPAEIIVTDGPPSFSPIPGTQVQIVTNGNERAVPPHRYRPLLLPRLRPLVQRGGAGRALELRDHGSCRPTSRSFRRTARPAACWPPCRGPRRRRRRCCRRRSPARRRSTAARRRSRSPMSASRNSSRSPAPASPMR